MQALQQAASAAEDRYAKATLAFRRFFSLSGNSAIPLCWQLKTHLEKTAPMRPVTEPARGRCVDKNMSSKNKSKKKTGKAGQTGRKAGQQSTGQQSAGQQNSAAPQNSALSREAIEALLVAILLALLFRGFEAEAFIIPTGSMAPTLSGRHKDVHCPQCEFQYRVGAAQESPLDPIVSAACPMCRFRMEMDPKDANHSSFNGDRILVNKYVYQFTEPKRWDVIVFKCPSNPKQNYIKRLVGLPNEALKVVGGDVYAKADGETQFKKLRKPAKKLPYIMHEVHDTRHVPEQLVKVGWPSRWQDRSPSNGSPAWSVSEDQNECVLAASSDTRWLGYRHLIPTNKEWAEVKAGRLPVTATERLGSLVTDFYEYNSATYVHPHPQSGSDGWHWVGDLACEAIVDIGSLKDQSGTLSLRLVEGGLDHVFEIDVETGVATITIEDGQLPFDGVDGQSAGIETLTAKTPIKGPGSYRLMWANVDDQLILWVNRKQITFEADGKPHSGNFTTPLLLTPRWAPEDDGDLTPIAIGGKNLELKVRNLRVLRDAYYAAVSDRERGPSGEYKARINHGSVQGIFASHQSWATEPLFDSRNEVDFDLGVDEFFPMGDNSPFSLDARLWSSQTNSLFLEDGISVEPNVKREMLIGKAFMVYWPHTWNPGKQRLPVFPNLDRMGFIR